MRMVVSISSRPNLHRPASLLLLLPGMVKLKYCTNVYHLALYLVTLHKLRMKMAALFMRRLIQATSCLVVS